MKNALLTGILALLALTFSSCFEVREEITMLEDGSGHAMLLVNMSESKETIRSFMERGEANGKKLPSVDQINEKLNEMKEMLSSANGISDVEIFSDFSNYNFNINLNFTNVTSLNAAINKVAKDVDDADVPVETVDNFAYKPGTFSRLYDYSFEPMSQEDYESQNIMLRMVAEAAKVVQIYRFAKPVKSVSNPNAKLSTSKTSVRIQHKAADLMTGKSKVDADIKF